VKAVGGVAEVAVGITVGAATSWTGVGAVAGGVVALHGLDTIQAGFRQAISGDEIDTGTSMAMQGAGLSRNTANLVDAGIGLASGAAGLASGASKTAAIMRTSEASGLSVRQALSLYDEGAQALNNTDFIALSKIASTPLRRGQEIRSGFELTTTATQRLTQSLKLANTGLTPSGDLLMGATSLGSNLGRAIK
jgi:hypothetical protein